MSPECTGDPSGGDPGATRRGGTLRPMAASEAETRRPDAGTVMLAGTAVVVTGLLVALAPRAVGADPTVEVVTQVLLALAVGTGVLVVARRGRPEATGGLVALLTGLFLCGGAAIILNGSRFGPLGYLADQGFRTAYLTKFGHTWSLVDHTYRDLPSFYPPLYFWLLGRAGPVVGAAPWEMLKIGMLTVAFLVPTAGWLLWRPVVGPRRAAVVVVVTSLVFQEWYVPQLWLAIVVFVPWWLHFVLGVGRDPDRRAGPGALALGVLLGAVVACTYWYVLFVAALHLVALLGTRRISRRHGRTPEPADLRAALIVLAGVGVVTAPYWLPLAVSILSTPGSRAMQNRYFTAGEVPFPTPFLAFDLEGFVLLAGLVGLAATAHRRRVSLHLLGLVVAAYALYLLGYVGFLADFPLDTLRTQGLLEYLLAAGAALAAVDLARLATATGATRRIDRTAMVMLVGLGAVVLTVAFGQEAVRSMPYVEQQRATTDPGWIDGFDRALAGSRADPVVLTDAVEIPAFLPAYLFNATNAHYSHPAARFEARADLLTRLGRERDPEAFALALLHNRYDQVDAVALRAGAGGLRYSWLDDAFPNGVRERSVTFPAAAFDQPVFSARTVPGSGLTVYRVDRAQDPLRSLRDCPRAPQRQGCAVLGRLLTRYGPHLDDATATLARRWQRAR
ncbi:MAG: hypothetical protein FJW77_04665 [Actinobacteria bacterium]|nr:hypothetical protein [Actinomycetota bacterium]